MIVAILLLVVLGAVVASLLLYFGNWRTFPWYVQFTCFVAWLFPFSIILMLPLDLASNLHRRCLEEGGENPDCNEPLAYVGEDFLWGFWQIVYWTMQMLTWFIIPIMLSWVRSGDFQPLPKLWNSIKDNLMYYAVVGAIGIVFLIYMLFAIKFQKEDLVALLMAAANAWGLLLCTIMLGYGVVEIPRGLWKASFTAKNLRELELQAPKAKEKMMDSEAQIYEVARDIAIASKKVTREDPLRKYVDVLLEKCPLALDERAADDDDDGAPVTLDKLRAIHSRLIYYTNVNARHQAQFRFLLHRAWLLNDILDNEKSREKKFKSQLIKPAPEGYQDLKVQALWWWYIYIQPICLRSLAVVLMVASLALVWSESTFQVTSVYLSVPALLMKSKFVTVGWLEFVSISFLMYMCVCAYSTLFKIKIFDYYVIVPEHNTDEPTLLFVGAYLCRLTFPLCYNFLNMAMDDENSIFVKYQGKFIDLAPLLGDGFNTWVPDLVLIFALLTLLNLFSRIVDWLRIKKYFYDDEKANSEADIEEGRQIILQARSAEERRLGRGAYIASSSYGLTSLEAGRAGSKPRATNTKDLLAKYQNVIKDGGRSNAGAGGSSSSGNRGRTDSNARVQASAVSDPFSNNVSSNTSPPKAKATPTNTSPSSGTFSLKSAFGFGGGTSSPKVAPAALSGTAGASAGKYQRLDDSGGDDMLLGSSPAASSAHHGTQSTTSGGGGSTRKFGRSAEPSPHRSAGAAVGPESPLLSKKVTSSVLSGTSSAQQAEPAAKSAAKSDKAAAKSNRRNLFDDL